MIAARLTMPQLKMKCSDSSEKIKNVKKKTFAVGKKNYNFEYVTGKMSGGAEDGQH